MKKQTNRVKLAFSAHTRFQEINAFLSKYKVGDEFEIEKVIVNSYTGKEDFFKIKECEIPVPSAFLKRVIELQSDEKEKVNVKPFAGDLYSRVHSFLSENSKRITLTPLSSYGNMCSEIKASDTVGSNDF